MSNNFGHTSVSVDEQVSVYSISMVIIGIVITVPAFLVGSQVLRSLGLVSGALAIMCSCFVIAFLASLCMRLAAKYHISTYQLSVMCFGQYGARIVSGVIAITLLGWFAMTANLFGNAARGLSEDLGLSIPTYILITTGCGFVIATVIYGFSALAKFSRLATPFLGLLLIAGVLFVLKGNGYRALFDAEPVYLTGMENFGAAVSVIIGAFMVAITISPDFARFSASPGDGMVAAWLGYGLGGSLVLIGSGLPGLALGSDDIVGSFAATGLGVGAFILLIIATWTTNAGNLYSAQLAVSHISPKTKTGLICIGLGMIGTASALWLDLNYFGKFLQFLAAAIPPIAGVYLCHGYILRDGFSHNEVHMKHWNPSAFLAWGAGTLIAFLSTFGVITIIHIPAVEALFIAMIVYWGASNFLKQEEQK